MAAVVENPADIVADVIAPNNGNGAASPNDNQAECAAVDLGIWLSALHSFLLADHSFEFRGGGHIPDASLEMELTITALDRCLVLCTSIPASLAGLGGRDIQDLTRSLNELVVVGRCIKRAKPISAAEWLAWRGLVEQRLKTTAGAQLITRHSDVRSEEFLPEPLLSFVSTDRPLTDEQAELALVLPRFGLILRSLNIVGRMLDVDEPLKPALVIMSRVNELSQELISYLDTRLERFPDKSGEIFASLDGAGYLASIELKKVYTHEMAGLIRVRPATTVHSGMETAYSVLNESFQQILASLAKLVDPQIDHSAIFPSFKKNFERSMALRRELWNLARLTQAAEANPDKRHVQSLDAALKEFMDGPVKYLFYKDTETVERFVEEISVAKQELDLVPILHRFGAYLETLFSQVSMRAVLEHHPFEPAP